MGSKFFQYITGSLLKKLSLDVETENFVEVTYFFHNSVF